MSNFIDKFSLASKKAIVTGGAKGPYNRMAQALHDAGAEVAPLDVLDMAEDSAGEMARKGPMIHAARSNLTRTEELKSVYNEYLENLEGEVDILSNGAGIQFGVPVADSPYDRWEEIIAPNVNAVFYMPQLAGKTMLAQECGKIINIVSMTAFSASALIPAYGASKGGVAQITKALFNEWTDQDMNVDTAAPRYMATELTANVKEVNPKRYEEIASRIPTECWGRMEDLQGLAVFLTSDASAYVSDVVIPADGGLMGK